MVRLVHLSDIHVSSRKLEWHIKDFLDRRIAGWINHRWLGRRRRFRHAKKILGVLAEELQERRPDHVIFSGDATALGFESELRAATALLKVKDAATPSGLAVPGNHDYATKRAATSLRTRSIEHRRSGFEQLGGCRVWWRRQRTHQPRTMT